MRLRSAFAATFIATSTSFFPTRHFPTRPPRSQKTNNLPNALSDDNDVGFAASSLGKLGELPYRASENLCKNNTTNDSKIIQGSPSNLYYAESFASLVVTEPKYPD